MHDHDSTQKHGVAANLLLLALDRFYLYLSDIQKSLSETPELDSEAWWMQFLARSSAIVSSGIRLMVAYNGNGCGDLGLFYIDDFGQKVFFRHGIHKAVPNADAILHTGKQIVQAGFFQEQNVRTTEKA